VADGELVGNSAPAMKTRGMRLGRGRGWCGSAHRRSNSIKTG
jgi:hypothetical protein